MSRSARSRQEARRIARAAHGRHRAPPPTLARRFNRFNSNNALAMAGFLAAAHLLLALLTFLPQPHTGGDNAAYITLGRSLLQRHAYLSLFDPAAPPHTQYPPVFPGILALAMLVGVRPWVGLKVVIALALAVAVGFSFLWVERRRRPALALGVAVILAASPGVLEQAHWILSDVPFWCFTALALWAFERMGPELRARFAVAVLATVLAYFTRSAGLPLVLAALAWLGLRRRWRQLLVLAAVLLPLVALWYLRARAQGGVAYVNQFWFVNPYQPQLGRIGAIDLFDRVLENASKYITIHLPILLTGSNNVFAVLLSALTTVLGVYGWTRRLRLRRLTMAELFLPLYIGLLLVWPAVWSGERFLLPALPLVLYYAGDGLARLGRLAQRVRPQLAFHVATAATALVLVAMVPQETRSVAISGQCMMEYRAGNRYPCQPPAWRDWFDVAEWARTALPPGAAVLSRKPTLMYVISGHAGRYYPMSSEPDSLVIAAQDAKARYIVVDHLDALSQSYLIPAMVNRIAAYCGMYRSPRDGTLVLGVLPGADTVPDVRVDPSKASIVPCGAGFWSDEALRQQEAAKPQTPKQEPGK